MTSRVSWAVYGKDYKTLVNGKLDGDSLHILNIMFTYTIAIPYTSFLGGTLRVLVDLFAKGGR